MLLNKIKRAFMFITGTILLLISIFFLLFPIIPIRPLLKLTEFCYFNSSEKVYDWYTNHEIFGAILNRKPTLTKSSFYIRLLVSFIILFFVMYFVEVFVIRLIFTLLFIFYTIYCFYNTIK